MEESSEMELDLKTLPSFIRELLDKKDSESVPHTDVEKRNNFEEISLSRETFHTEEESPERGSTDKSFICFTYYDRTLNVARPTEPPYCVIEEKNMKCDDVKKLLELSHSAENSKPRIYESRRRPVTKSLKKKWSRQDYLKARTHIYEKITFFYSTGVIVWIPEVNCRIEFVHTLVKKYGDILTVHDRWISDKEENPSNWGGVLVVYSTPKEAEMAKIEIPKRHGFIKTLGLSELLDCLVHAELENFQTENTDIFINLPGKSKESQMQLQALLNTFGQVIPENSYEVIGQNSIQYKTAYSCATYAFLAMAVLDGLPFDSSNLKVEVRENKKEKAILKDFGFYMQKYIGSAAFLFKGLQ